MNDVLGAFMPDSPAILSERRKISRKTRLRPSRSTDIICDKCGARMIVKTGRYGRFACPNYPTCKTPSLSLRKARYETSAGSGRHDMRRMRQPDGRPLGTLGQFHACSRYPECKFTKRIDREIGLNAPIAAAR